MQKSSKCGLSIFLIHYKINFLILEKCSCQYYVMINNKISATWHNAIFIIRDLLTSDYYILFKATKLLIKKIWKSVRSLFL